MVADRRERDEVLRDAMPNDLKKIEAFMEEVLETIQPWYAEVARTSPIRDQAAAAVRNQMHDYGLDYTDPVVIGAWLAAVTYFPLALFLTEGDFTDAVRLSIVTGLIGRVEDGDSSSGT